MPGEDVIPNTDALTESRPGNRLTLGAALRHYGDVAFMVGYHGACYALGATPDPIVGIYIPTAVGVGVETWENIRISQEHEYDLFGTTFHSMTPVMERGARDGYVGVSLALGNTPLDIGFPAYAIGIPFAAVMDGFRHDARREPRRAAQREAAGEDIHPCG